MDSSLKLFNEVEAFFFEQQMNLPVVGKSIRRYDFYLIPS
tara:strand:- start:192 stop:311 length:120 start_codon:yes stop_codon:yes gene_type:complete